MNKLAVCAFASLVCLLAVLATPALPVSAASESAAPAGDITANVYPPFIDEGTVVILTAPEGATYQWKKDGAEIPGATEQTLNFAPVSAADAGLYTVEYETAAKALAETMAFQLDVSPAGTVPAASLLGLVTLASACGFGGTRLIRRRKA